MTSYEVKTVLSANVSPFVAGMRKAEAASKRLTAATLRVSNTQTWRRTGTMLLAAGAAMGAMVGKVVAESAKYEKALAGIRATGQEARDSINDLSAAAIHAGQITAWSAAEAAEGVTNLLKAGVSARDVLDGGLTGALALASAGELSVAEAAETASSALTQFGLRGRDVGRIADVLAAGANKAQGDVHDLSLALKQSGMVANQFGLSLEDTVGVLASFASNGMLSSDAGTSFKTMLLRLAAPAGASKRLMKQLGIEVYDTTGKFVGIVSLAQQLHDKLGPLSEAQRNAALATMFGSDAIRAANVLYKEGGEGITEWISKVDDSGFASEVASERLNNLKGDLKILAGSWETALIKMGESGQGPLREIVQQITELVNWVSSLDAGTQRNIIRTAATLAGLALTAGGIMKAITAISHFHAAIQSLKTMQTVGPIVQRFGTKIKGLQKTLIVGAAALVAFRTAAQILTPKDTSTVEEYEQALRRLTASSNDTGAATKTLAQLITNGEAEWVSASKGVDTLAGAMERVANPSVINQIGDGIEGVLGPLLGLTPDMQAWTSQFKKLDQALTSMDTDSAASAFRELQEAQKTTSLSTEQLLNLMPEYHSKLVAEANQLGVTTLAAADYAAWMGGDIPIAIMTARAEAENAAQTQNRMANAFDESTKAAQAAVDAMREYANQQLQISGTAIGVEAAIADATAAVKENGKNLDITTAKGRANQTALNGIASAALAYSSQLREAGKSEDEVAAATARARQQFIKTAARMGMNRQEALELASAYGLDADRVSALTARMQALPENVRAEIQTIYRRDGADAAEKALRRLSGKTVYTYVKTIHKDGSVRTGSRNRVGRASGGYVTGPGTSTSDSIPAFLSNGEYVIRAAAVKRLGLRQLDLLNRGVVPRFASGGLVSRGSVSSTTDSSVHIGAVQINPSDLSELHTAVQWAEYMKQLPRLAQQGVI